MPIFMGRHSLSKKPIIRRITRAAALQLIEETRESLHHVDPFVDGAIEAAQKIYRVIFQDKERFLSLVWPEVDGGRILTPPEEPRTLEHVANRMVFNNWTFDDLVEDMSLVPALHDPELFTKSRYLDENFDYDKFGLLILAPLKEEEREQSPKGSFYIYDGFHRALVLARLLLLEELEYERISGILVIPRPL